MQILFRLLNSGYLSDMHGCISTGKEANVYHATTGEGEDLAIKIYKTSILVFKDRDRYLSMHHYIDCSTYLSMFQHIVALHTASTHAISHFLGLCIKLH